MNDEFVRNVVQECDRHLLDLKNKKVVLGFSGGVDSVGLFLLLLCLRERINLKFVAVYVNHCIRKEASKDEEFVKGMCEKYKVDLVIKKVDIPMMAKELKKSVEDTGRIYRKSIFEQILKEEQADYIALAHHANDRAETILHNIIRGCGTNGTQGIKFVNGHYIRPFLYKEKKEIEEFVSRNNETNVYDITNKDNTYTRNYIRNVVIKDLEKINKNAALHINSLGDIALEQNEFVEFEISKFLYKKDNCFYLCKNKENIKRVGFCENKNKSSENSTDLAKELVGISINSKKLGELHKFLQKEIIRKVIYILNESLYNITKNNILDIYSLNTARVGSKIDITKNLIALKEYEEIIFIKKAYEKSRFDDYKEISDVNISDIKEKFNVEILDIDDKINLQDYMIENTYTKYFDYDIIKGSLEFGFRQDGDVISLIKGHKTKLKKIFIDKKVPRLLRDKIPLVRIKGSGEVLWLVGFRMNKDYQITDDTKRVLKISYNNK